MWGGGGGGGVKVNAAETETAAARSKPGGTLLMSKRPNSALASRGVMSTPMSWRAHDAFTHTIQYNTSYRNA